MTDCPNVIYINGHQWWDVANETNADAVYSLAQVKAVKGDPRRIHEVENITSSDGR